MRRCFLSLLLLLAGACALSSERPTPRGASAKPGAPPSRARLVVAVVLDQLPSWAFERYFEHLPEDGALRTLAGRGALHRRAFLPYATTSTAPGHATLFTGAAPSVHNVVANRVWSRARGKSISSLDDGEHAVHGGSGFASPRPIGVETVADALERDTGGKARVVALSLKDRGAIPGGGRSPDAVLWYDSKLPGFTTSAYYAAEPPAWLEAWQRRHPLDALLGAWEPGDPELLARVAGADDVAGEGDLFGMGRTFPHAPSSSEKPYSVVRATPQSAEHLLELARACVEQYELGADEVPDLLAISISTTDYVGHAFGAESWEYLDNLIRVDRALGRFLGELEARGPIAVLVTSDHGGTPLPEASRAQGKDAGRILPAELAARLDRRLDGELGPADWVEAFEPPFLHLASAPEVTQAVRARAAELLAKEPSVRAAHPVDQARTWGEDRDPLRRAIALSLPSKAPGDLYVVMSPGYVFDLEFPPGAGTAHGSPWQPDREVPVLFAGPGVRPLDSAAKQDLRAVAATLTALLGVPPPERALPEPLPGLAK